MNAYDFDGTVYDGDSTADFFRFCAKRSLKIRLLTPYYLLGFIPYKMGIINKTRAKRHFYNFVRAVPDMDGAVKAFWDKNQVKIKGWYRKNSRHDDIVLSASPRFTLREICARLGIKSLICSEVNEKTGEYSGLNCHGEEKVRRLEKEYPGAVIEEFYSDSFNDAPLARLSQRAFCVRGDRIYPWDEYFSK
ncbi:MAG: HAD-IB family phosphatase [Clostridia bacterium]|nr:HAD-IB family phosphatase [Clostridia bacterium]